MNTSPIGVFDSGLGGLTVVKALRRLLPNEKIIYFGDTGRVPYGNRSAETIYKYALSDMRFLLSKRVKMIIAACGTVSSVAENAGNGLSVPYTGVVRPASKAAVEATRNGRIGVTGTAATIASGSYRKRIKELCPTAEVFEQACPLFVPLVESGFIDPDDNLTRLAVERYLLHLLDNKIDTLILGCTHYPILKPIIADVMGSDITLIDAGEQTAIYAANELTSRGLLCPAGAEGSQEYFVSDHIEGFASVAGIFLGEDISGLVHHVEPESLV